LLNGYAVTDYFAQGLTFKDSRWIVHLTPPPAGQFARASIVVIISRYRSWDDVFLLEPLWHDGSQRLAVIERFQKALAMHSDLEAELARLQTAASRHARLSTQALPPAAAPPAVPPASV
jgi:hypothetical protein